MADTAHGDIVYPLADDDFSVPTVMLAMANSLDPRVIGQYTSKGNRDTATSALTGAGKRVVAWVDGNVGLCAHNGTAWVNLSPPVTYNGNQVLGGTAPNGGGSSYVAPTAAVTINDLVNGQLIDVRAHGSVRINGSGRQSALMGVEVTGAVPVTPDLFPVIWQTPYADGTEYKTCDYEGRYFADNGTTTLKFKLTAGSGGDDLVLGAAQMWVTVYPLDAA